MTLRVHRGARRWAISLHGLGAVALALTLCLMPDGQGASAEDLTSQAIPIQARNMGVARIGSAEAPRSEHDQTLADGWPLYRSDRGQEAFNHAMATLRATDGDAPAKADFRGCRLLHCNLTLPAIDENGWLPAGRLWVSANEYMIIAHSPRLADGKPYRRRAKGSMKVFVLHEFQSSSFNTDTYDTISSHARSVFVPLYMSKEQTDAKGRRFVVVVQVAPYDVVSRHATNWGHAGPGIEVAKNTADVLEPLQSLAGIVVTAMIKEAAPSLRVVNHRGLEGLPMLRAYERRLAKLKDKAGNPAVTLPFTPAKTEQLVVAAARLDDLIVRREPSAPIPIAQRTIVPPRPFITASASGGASAPKLIGPIKPAIRPPSSRPVLIGPILLARRPIRMTGGVEHHP